MLGFEKNNVTRESDTKLSADAFKSRAENESTKSLDIENAFFGTKKESEEVRSQQAPKSEEVQEDKKEESELNDSEHLSNDDMFSSENTDEVEEIKKEDVSVEKTPLTDEEIGRMGSENNVTYKTKYVAEQLGVSEQLVRNYCVAFNEFLNIETTPTGHRTFKKSDIDQLAQLIQIKTEKNFTIEETVEFLRGDAPKVLIAPPEQKLDMILNLIHEEVKKAITEAKNESIAKIEEKDMHENENYSSITKELEEKNKIIEDLKKTVEHSNKTIQELIEENKQTNEQIMGQLQELGKKKKFSLFKKK